MIKKIFLFLLFNISYNNFVISFRMNDDFILYIIDNDLQNTSKKMDKTYSKHNMITNNGCECVIKFTQSPPKKKKNNKLKRIRNSTKKKRREDCQENGTYDIIPYIQNLPFIEDN